MNLHLNDIEKDENFYSLHGGVSAKSEIRKPKRAHYAIVQSLLQYGMIG